MAAANPHMVFSDVHIAFAGKPVHAGVSLQVQRGSVHFIMGQSGVGKSVLIKALVGLVHPDRGSITFDGTEVVGLSEAQFFPIRRRCQMVFQQATLFGSLSVLDNVAMPIARHEQVSMAVARQRASEVLESLHARHLGERLSATLGPGLRKQVAIARALALNPEALLYDEPTTGLDPIAARRTDRLIRETSLRLGVTSVVVSHDLQSLLTIGDWVSFLHAGQLHFDGPPAEFFAATDSAVRAFVRAGSGSIGGC